jgi:hypothetical protein
VADVDGVAVDDLQHECRRNNGISILPIRVGGMVVMES